ncbi:alpha/beta fold hydrolase [Cumulibacter manganitolerans]|uniref:alpha/beta fold hydrolase n=1 Tax=Cumulibacter manganitolerans TaxID=1884992 RepID=UPI001296E58D|nr:alpha/beta fold hydrolase [Cumulibacter manganitolerans]
MRQFLTRDDGVRLAYEIHNPDAAGTPMVITHGYSATAAMWEPNIAALSENRPVLTYDQRGHGQSGDPGSPEGYSEAINVADIDALVDLLDAPKVIVAGMSLGGYLSMAYYLAHPERVAALLLQDTGPGYKSDESRNAWNQHVEAIAVEKGSDDPEASQSAEVVRAVHDNPKALAHAARGVLAQRDARVISSLPRIAVPTLVVVGANDVGYLAGTDYMVAKIPGARKVVIPDAGHAANIDQPELFNAAVTDFLRDL